ncbi:uncharacterized protein LOC125742326 [Brienomyrus brachyistius]|uniref:uncharacterized protein LOC125742326 n=1 Tax=Brienomyrus brachyistius TaxID=42636 RepID=UPI0020B2013D|nr:uncharacterized protein LOC125742326 [Brienomyrus brachyistius]
MRHHSPGINPGPVTVYPIPLGNIIRNHGIGFHCYADDTQLYISVNPDDISLLSRLEDCLLDIQCWMAKNFLMLNTEKIEVLVIGPKAARNKFHHLNVGNLPTQPNMVVRNLGVLVDSDLCFDAHIRSITRTAFYHLRNIAKLRKMLSLNDAEKLIHAFVSSRLDYCNALLSGCPSGSLHKLQMVQNAAARVLTNTKKFDHITPVLSSLHWLPVKSRIDYKILLLTYKALNGLTPEYLSELLTTYNPPRLLRSQAMGYLLVPRVERATAGCRAFSYKARQLWNGLPPDVRVSGSLSIFKSRLKTHLFSLAYRDTSSSPS